MGEREREIDEIRRAISEISQRQLAMCSSSGNLVVWLYFYTNRYATGEPIEFDKIKRHILKFRESLATANADMDELARVVEEMQREDGQ